MRAITVCEGFADVLAVTLPVMRHHFDEYYVVTSSKDHDTRSVAERWNAMPFITDCFWDDGAHFAKWKALEKGLDAMGRHGIICILDVDIVWPSMAPINLEKGQLLSPLRRMMHDTSTVLKEGIPLESEWARFPLHRNQGEHAGYSQVFHADDSVLGPPPWHDTSWSHCGGSDSFFQARWPRERKVRPSWECLHLGDCGSHWLGRVGTTLDGTVLPGSESRKAELVAMFRERRERERKGEDKFSHEKIKPS